MNRNKFPSILLATICFVMLHGLVVSAQHIDINSYPSCGNVAEGYIVAEVLTEDYTPPFVFQLTDANGAPLFEETSDGLIEFQWLFPGNYCLTVTSDDGCSANTCDIVVEELFTPVISSITPICICPGGYGGVNLVVTGGSGNYGYAWSGPGIGVPNVQNPTVSAVGTYSVTIVDSQSGCTAVGQTTVTNCNVSLSSDNVQVTPDCNAAGTSTLSIQLPTGYGFEPFTFRWIKVGFGLVETDVSAQGYASLLNAEQGEYCLNILTANGCNVQFCGINVLKRTKPVIAYSITPPSNGSNGAISVSATGQPGPFTYLWDTGQTTASRTGLAPGNYCVTVTDVISQCTASKCFDLTSCNALQQSLVSLQATVTAITTTGGVVTGGAINITNVLDQFPGYRFNFAWSNGATTEDISGLVSGW